MARIATKAGRLTALAAMLALVAQAFLSSWALAANADRPALDAFGNPLCIGNQVGGHDPAQTGVPACCKVGCAPVLGWAAPPIENGVILRQKPPVMVVDAALAAAAPPQAKWTLGARPRAPPALNA